MLKFVAAGFVSLTFVAGALFPSVTSVVLGGFCVSVLGMLFAFAQHGLDQAAESADGDPISLLQIEYQLEIGMDHAVPVYVLGVKTGASPVQRAYVANVSGRRSMVLEVN